MIYTIYHGTRPNGNNKIGCDEAYPNRPIQQSLTNYYVLEEHVDELVASRRELELQREYDLPVDIFPYHLRKVNGNKGGIIRANNPNNNFKHYSHEQWSRINKGKGGYLKKLTYEIAQEIRDKYSGVRGQQSALAKEYGVTTKLISNLINNKTYKQKQ